MLKRMGLVAVLLLIIGSQGAFAAQWAKSFGGGKWDFGYSAIQVSDGYILAGDTASFGAGNTDLLLIKLNTDGTVAWKRTYGGVENDEEPFAIRQTSDNGFIVVGKTESFGAGFCDIWVLRFDAQGNRLWERTFGGQGYDGGYDIQETPDGGYILVGDTNASGSDYDIWVLRLDANGGIRWQKKFGGAHDDYAFSVAVAPDGSGYYVAGATASSGAGNNDIWVLKLNNDGGVVWQRTFGGAKDDYANSVHALSDGCIIAGTTYSFGKGGSDAWILRLNVNGDVVWQKTYGGGKDDSANSIIATSGGYVFVGSTASSGQGADDVLAVKLDAAGDILWQKSYGGTDNDYAVSVIEAREGGYIITGGTASFGSGGYDMWVLKTDANGVLPSSSGMKSTSLQTTTPGFFTTISGIVPQATTIIPNPSNSTQITIGDAMQPGSVKLTIDIVDANCDTASKAGSVLLSSPSNAVCNTTGGCVQSYASGTHVTLTAQPKTDYVFSQWAGTAADCGSSITCEIDMAANQTVEARFTKTLTPPPASGIFVYFDAVSTASCESPIGAGLAAQGSQYLDLHIKQPNFAVPMDIYLGFIAHDLAPNVLFLVTSTGIEQFSGTLTPWKQAVTSGFIQWPFGQQYIGDNPPIPGIAIPAGRYDIYLLTSPTGTGISQGYYLYNTRITVQ